MIWIGCQNAKSKERNGFGCDWKSQKKVNKEVEISQQRQMLLTKKRKKKQMVTWKEKENQSKYISSV